MSANPDNPPFPALADAPHDGSPIEVRTVLTKKSCWRAGSPKPKHGYATKKCTRRTLHRVTGWRPQRRSR